MNEKKLGLISLISLVVGAMIGSGIFSIPQNAAAEASIGASLIAWLITAIGMLCLTFVFMDLSIEQPHLDAGVYSYAKEGFGNFIGFSSAWGYWFTAVLGNVIYMVLIFSTLSYFFPNLEKGNTLTSIILSSILLWSIHYMISIGIKEASIISIITTICKIIPIIFFISLCLFFFEMKIFKENFWTFDGKTVFEQVKGMMLITVWVFVGIEGASIFSERAKNRKDIASATIIGLVLVLLLLILVNIVSFGVIKRPELAALANPSTSYILEKIIGKFGVYFMSFGLIISLLGAILAWILFASEILYQASIKKTFPSFLKYSNMEAVPINSLFLSNFVIQILLILTYFFKETYTSLLYLATSMILLPYFFSSIFGLKYSLYHDRKKRIIILYILAVIYSSWLIYAAGLKYLFLSSILYSCGLPLYFISFYEKNFEFKFYEKIIAIMIVSLSICGIYNLYNGNLSL